MSDFDSEESVQQSNDGTTYWQEEAKKAFAARDQAKADAAEARLELSRTRLEGEYGTEIVGLIPSGLPQEEWKDYAEKLKAFRGQAPAEPVENVEAEPEPEAQPVDEAALAATATGPSNTAAPSPGLGFDDLMQVAMTDPERYRKLKEQGHGLPKLPGSAQ